MVPVLTAALVRFKGWASSLRLASRDTPKLVAWYPGQMTGNERQRQTLIESLRVRFAKAVADNDADAKAALFKEAVYLGIQPDAFTGSTIDETA